MYVVALFWLLFAAAWLLRDSDYRYFYSMSGFSCAVILAGLTYNLNKRRHWAWWLATLFSVANIMLTVTDQVGWFDLAYLIPAIALFIMLLLSKKYIPQP